MPLYHWIFRLITWVFLDAFAHCPSVSVSSSFSIAETISAQAPDLPHLSPISGFPWFFSALPFFALRKNTFPHCLAVDSLSSFYFLVNTFVECLSYSILPLRTLNAPSSLSYQFLSFCFGNFQSNLFVFVCCVFSQLLSNNQTSTAFGGTILGCICTIIPDGIRNSFFSGPKARGSYTRRILLEQAKTTPENSLNSMDDHTLMLLQVLLSFSLFLAVTRATFGSSWHNIFCTLHPICNSEWICILAFSELSGLFSTITWHFFAYILFFSSILCCICSSSVLLGSYHVVSRWSSEILDATLASLKWMKS